jgi:hypothetical protein
LREQPDPQLLHLLVLAHHGLLTQGQEPPDPLAQESRMLEQWSRTSLSQAEALNNLESSLSPEEVQSLTLPSLARTIVDTLQNCSTALR